MWKILLATQIKGMGGVAPNSFHFLPCFDECSLCVKCQLWIGIKCCRFTSFCDQRLIFGLPHWMSTKYLLIRVQPIFALAINLKENIVGASKIPNVFHAHFYHGEYCGFIGRDTKINLMMKILNFCRVYFVRVLNCCFSQVLFCLRSSCWVICKFQIEQHRLQSDEHEIILMRMVWNYRHICGAWQPKLVDAFWDLEWR